MTYTVRKLLRFPGLAGDIVFDAYGVIALAKDHGDGVAVLLHGGHHVRVDAVLTDVIKAVYGSEEVTSPSPS
jgi:hypothetical protein